MVIKSDNIILNESQQFFYFFIDLTTIFLYPIPVFEETVEHFIYSGICAWKRQDRKKRKMEKRPIQNRTQAHSLFLSFSRNFSNTNHAFLLLFYNLQTLWFLYLPLKSNCTLTKALPQLQIEQVAKQKKLTSINNVVTRKSRLKIISYLSSVKTFI